MIYNSPYAVMIGDKHPQALGTPVKVAWHEIWGAIGIHTEEVLAGKVIEKRDGLCISSGVMRVLPDTAAIRGTALSCRPSTYQSRYSQTRGVLPNVELGASPRRSWQPSRNN